MILNLEKIINKKINLNFIKKYKFTNIHQLPKITKIVINTNFNTDLLKNDKFTKRIYTDLTMLTTQKPFFTKTKKSISNFHLKKNENIGFICTLRKSKKYYFLTKFIFFAVSQIKDFLGYSINLFDSYGNLNIGLKEQFVFPEIGFQDINKIFGLNINFIFQTNNKKINKEFLTLLNLPIYNENNNNNNI